MATENHESYFLLLDIGPDDPWDEALFDRQLRHKRAEWSRKKLNGPKSSPAVMQARRALDSLPEIERVMRDQVARERERVAARAQLADRHSAQLTDFERKLQIMAAKGYLLDVEVARLRQDYPNLLDGPPMAQ